MDVLQHVWLAALSSRLGSRTNINALKDTKAQVLLAAQVLLYSLLLSPHNLQKPVVNTRFIFSSSVGLFHPHVWTPHNKARRRRENAALCVPGPNLGS